MMKAIKHVGHIFILIGLTTISVTGNAQQVQQVMSKKGAFSVTPIGGMQTASYTTSSGQLAGFSGTTIGARMTFRPMSELVPGLSLFGEYMQSEGENDTLAAETYDSTAYHFGFTQHLSYFFYLGGSFGDRKIEFTNSAQNINVEADAKVAGVGLGFDIISIGEGWTLNLEAWQYFGYAAKTALNSDNKGVNSTEYFVGIKWSPTVSFASK